MILVMMRLREFLLLHVREEGEDSFMTTPEERCSNKQCVEGVPEYCIYFSLLWKLKVTMSITVLDDESSMTGK